MWRLGRACRERTLHHDRVAPAAEAISDPRQQSDPGKAEFFVQGERGRVVGIDIADHLAEAGGRTDVNQLLQQLAADAVALMVVMDIDRNKTT